MFRIINKALWAAVVVAAALLPLSAHAQLNNLGNFSIGLPWPPQVNQCLIGVLGVNGVVAQWGSCSGSGTTVSSVIGDGQVVASPTIGNVILSLGTTITNNEVFSSSLNVTGTFEIGGTPILAEATNSALGAVECDGTTINCSSGVISALGAPATSVTVGTTTVGSGTTGYLLYDNGGTLGNLATTGSGNAVLATSPTLVTPALGAATATTLAVGGASLGGNALAVAGSGSFSGGLTATTLTLSGLATGLATCVNPADGCPKSYIDAVAAGQTIYHTPVAVATAAVLPNTPTYNNGSSGVGATLTAGSDVALVVDGVTVSTLTTRVAVIDQASAFQNGIYTLTTAGNGSTEWVLTRATDFNTAEAGNIALGAAFGVTGGNTLANTSYWMNQTAAITVGTTAITFVEFPGCPQFSASIGGCVPATGGVDATHFLNAAGGFTVPAGGAGAVTSVGLTVPATSILGVTGSPVTTSGNLGLTTTGTSGGIPYFSSGSALSSSGTLTNHALVLGGGSGATPTSLASLGTTTTLLHGNAAGAPTYGPVALGTDVSGNLPNANMASIGTKTILGNATGGSATPTALSQTQFTALVNTFTPSLPGLVPASGGATGSKYLTDAGSFVPGTAAPTLQPCTVQVASYGLNYAGSSACNGGSDVNSLIPFLPSGASVVITVPQSTGTVFPPNTGATIYNQSNSPYPISVCLGTSAAWSASSTANIAANSLCPASGNGITLQRGETLQLVTDSANAWRAVDTPTPYPSSVLLPQNTLSGDPAGFSTGWTATRATLTSAAGGPVGNAPVGTVAEDTSTNTHIISQTISYAGPIQINVQTKAGTLTRNPYIVVTDAGGDQLSVVWTQSTCQPLLVQNNAGLIGQAAVLSQSGYHVFANGSDTGWCQLSATINMPGVTLNQFRLGLYNGGTFYTGSTGTLLFANAAVTPAPNAIPGPGRPIIIACTLPSQTATFTNSSSTIGLATTVIPVGCPVYFTTSGGLPTNFAVNTTYYVLTNSVLNITVSATPTGSAIVAGSAGTGTQTALDAAYLGTGSATTIMAMNLPSAIASDWDCTGNFIETPSSTSTINSGSIGVANNTLTNDASRFDRTAAFTSAGAESFVLGTSNFQVNAATPVYAVLKSTFAGTNTVQGNFRCRMFH